MLVTLDVSGVGAGTIKLRGAVSFRYYMNRYSQRLGGGPKHLSSTQPGSGLSLYKLSLLKFTNLPKLAFKEAKRAVCPSCYLVNVSIPLEIFCKSYTSTQVFRVINLL